MELERLKEMLSGESRKIAVVAHSNPDGDAVGSALAWGRLLRAQGHEVMCAVPNRFPYFLSWLGDVDQMRVYKNDPPQVEAFMAGAEIIFFLDFNTPARLEILADAVAANTTAARVLIDHHPQPSGDFDLVFSEPDFSSTSFLLYTIIEGMYGTGAIDLPMAEALYVGMMTDTGNFSFSNLSPGLYRAIAVLVEKGVDIPRINSLVYNSFTEGRMRLQGYALYRKMEIIEPYKAAYISLTEAELRRFDFQVGDTEGFVNMPLSIGEVVLSAMFVQTRQFIRVSLRSRGDVDVNRFARAYFNGGGHRNAAGGKSFVPMGQTIDHFRRSVEEFFEKK